MKQLFSAIALAVPILANLPASAQEMPPCEDYDAVMSIFEQQGTEYRGTTEGPNHRTVEVFENVATGKGIAILHDRDNSRACVVSFGFDYEALAARTTIQPPASE